MAAPAHRLGTSSSVFACSTCQKIRRPKKKYGPHLCLFPISQLCSWNCAGSLYPLLVLSEIWVWLGAAGDFCGLRCFGDRHLKAQVEISAVLAITLIVKALGYTSKPN